MDARAVARDDGVTVENRQQNMRSGDFQLQQAALRTFQTEGQLKVILFDKEPCLQSIDLVTKIDDQVLITDVIGLDHYGKLLRNPGGEILFKDMRFGDNFVEIVLFRNAVQIVDFIDDQFQPGQREIDVRGVQIAGNA